jgi:GNAT superfamily N-acetyltransferase
MAKEFHIMPISFSHVLPIWEKYLWPGRKDITSHSAMSYLEGHDMKNMSLPLHCFGAFKGNELVGVNTGHLCSDNSFRSRGLWVMEAERGNGLGFMLLDATCKMAQSLKCPYVWSYPRKSSWSTYEKAGFDLSSDFKKSDTSEANAFCIQKIYNTLEY